MTPARRRPAAPTDACEALEPRALLTTFVVTDGGDVTDAGDGELTYREALLAAEANAGADVVTFADGVDFVALGADLPALTGDLSVVGGAGGVIVDHGGNAGLALSGGDFAFSNVTFADAARQSGGALDVTGGATLTVTGGAFADNAAGEDGGAVRLLESGGTFAGVTFDGNAAARGGAVFADGESSLLLTDVRAVRNVAADAGGAVFAGSGDGPAATISGGYFALNVSGGAGGAVLGGGLTVAGATFSSNTAGGSADAAASGAFDPQGGAVYVVNDESTITDATFFRNAAGEGGAVFVFGTELTVADATFNRNAASGSGGGGIALDFGVLTLSGVRMVSNTALGADGFGSGGAVFLNFESSLTADGGRFAQNRAARAGGAVFAPSDTLSLSLSNLTLNRNRAGEGVPDGSVDPDLSDGIGGGAVFADASFFSGTFEVTLTDLFVARNRAVGEFADGGGLLLQDVEFSLTDSNVAANRAGRNGGNVAVAGTGPDGGGSFTDTALRGGRAEFGGGLAVRDGNKPRARTDVTFAGGGLFGNRADARGGGLHVELGQNESTPVAVELDGAAVRGNLARQGGGASVAGDGADVNARLDATGGTVFRDNRGMNRGGALVVGGRATLDGALFVGNEDRFGGGAAYVFEGGLVRVLDAVFRDNESDTFGGPGRVDDRR